MYLIAQTDRSCQAERDVLQQEIATKKIASGRSDLLGPLMVLAFLAGNSLGRLVARWITGYFVFCLITPAFVREKVPGSTHTAQLISIAHIYGLFFKIFPRPFPALATPLVAMRYLFFNFLGFCNILLVAFHNVCDFA